MLTNADVCGGAPGTQFTCMTGTKVPILTSLLDLLVQKSSNTDAARAAGQPYPMLDEDEDMLTYAHVYSRMLA